jgi:hypothetical protein
VAFTETFPFDFYVPAAYRRPYTLEVRTADGELVRKLSRFFDARFSSIINEPGEIEFSILATDETGGELSGANEIWVRDHHDAILKKFRVSRREETAGPEGVHLRVSGRGLLADLAAEPLDEYAATATIAAHLATWFAGQTGLNPVTVGTVSSAIGGQTRTLDLSGQQSILAAIVRLEETLAQETFFWVDNDRAFQWRLASATAYRGYQLRTKRNITSLRRTVDYDAQATRVYARGANVEGRYVRLSDATGATTNYLQSALLGTKYRRQIVIDHMSVPPPGDTDYAFNYVLASDAHLAAHAASDGSDIAFFGTADATTALVSAVNSYTAATGALDATITIPTLSAAWDTVIYMVYGT